MSKSLDELLIKASIDKKYYKQFIDCLINSYIYVPSAKNDLCVWKNVDGSSFVPFFSSLSGMKSGNLIATKFTDSDYLKISGKEFFIRNTGVSVVLNPNLKCSKEFTVEEVQWIKHQVTLTYLLNYSSGNKILVYQPIETPSEMLNSLVEIFIEYNQIHFASYGKISIVESKIVEYHLIGLNTTDNFTEWLSGILLELKNHQIKIENIRFVDMKNKNEIADCLRSFGYFYDKNKLGE